MKHAAWILLIGCLGLPPAAGLGDTQPPRIAPKPAGIPQWSGQYGGGPSFSTRVVRGADAWAALRSSFGDRLPDGLNPSTQMAVVVEIGGRPTGGYSVSILSAAASQGSLVVTYAERAPGRGQFVTEALTNPWVVAILPRSDLPVVFRAAAPPP
jgi:PrcB C-terminal